MRRFTAIILTAGLAAGLLAVSLLAAVTIAGIFLKDAAMETDFGSKNLAPSMSHLFGTDWMGQDLELPYGGGKEAGTGASGGEP